MARISGFFCFLLVSQSVFEFLPPFSSLVIDQCLVFNDMIKSKMKLKDSLSSHWFRKKSRLVSKRVFVSEIFAMAWFQFLAFILLSFFSPAKLLLMKRLWMMKSWMKLAWYLRNKQRFFELHGPNFEFEWFQLPDCFQSMHWCLFRLLEWKIPSWNFWKSFRLTWTFFSHFKFSSSNQ